VEAGLAVAHVDIIFLLLGLYGWEYFQSFSVEYAIIRGRLPFRWPLVPYLLGRLFVLTYLVLLAIGTIPLSGGFACQSGITSIAVRHPALGHHHRNFLNKSHDSHMGDLGEVPFGASPVITTCSWSLDHIGTRCGEFQGLQVRQSLCCSKHTSSSKRRSLGVHYVL